MNTQDLLKKYLEADTSVVQERELAAADPDIARLSEALCAGAADPLPEAEEEFDRIVRQARRRQLRRRGFAASGLAAVLAAVVLLTRQPAEPLPAAPDAMEMIRQVQFFSDLDPIGADGYEFTPVGDGYILTARFEDGTATSFLLTPLDGGQTLKLIALQQ